MRLDPAALVALQLQVLRISKMADPSKPAYIQTPEQWEQLRHIITKLYLEDGLTLPEVMKEIERRGFRAK